MNCTHCHIGHYQSVQIPYVQWHDGQIMVIPDAPASSCDVCGYLEYDRGFLYKLDYLLDKLAKNSSVSDVPQPHSVMIEPAQWSPSGRSR